MAIQRNYSRLDFERKVDVLLDPAYTGVLENGMLLMQSANAGPNGEQLVIPTAGASTDRIVGVLWVGDRSQADVPVFEDVVIPSAGPYTVTLREIPLAVTTAVRVMNGATLIAVTAGTVAGAGAVAIGGTTSKLLTADSTLAGATLRVTYRFSITAAELARRGGVRSINIGPERSFNQVGALQGNMEVTLSNFLTIDPYDTITNFAVRTQANGKFGTSGSGAIVGRVTKAPFMELTPGIEQAFVTVQINVTDL